MHQLYIEQVLCPISPEFFYFKLYHRGGGLHQFAVWKNCWLNRVRSIQWKHSEEERKTLSSVGASHCKSSKSSMSVERLLIPKQFSTVTNIGPQIWMQTRGWNSFLLLQPAWTEKHNRKNSNCCSKNQWECKHVLIFGLWLCLVRTSK